jgi:hypothetical protein
MRLPVLSVALLLAGAVPGLAFDTDTENALGRMKAGKLVPASEIAVLMRGAERWCYHQQENNCSWSDIYLSVDDDLLRYEISNPWNEDVDISFVDQGVFKDNRYVCEVGFDWVPSVRAFSREDGNAIEGRALEALRQEIRDYVTTADNADCFDYVYQGADSETQIVTLLQRQYTDGVTDPLNDAVVTLFFDKAVADELGWYW